jgi:hypothetical protein
MSDRFSYINYDETSKRDSENAKHLVERLEQQIETLPNGRAKSLALTKLEECFGWIGKGIRDAQIEREAHLDSLLKGNETERVARQQKEK